MVKDAWQMLYRTQEWLPWINNLCKKVLGNIATLGIHPIRMHRGLVPTSGDQQKETAFISCKWPHSVCKIGVSIPSEGVHPAGWTWARVNSILIQRKASLPSHAATSSGVVSGLT